MRGIWFMQWTNTGWILKWSALCTPEQCVSEPVTWRNGCWTERKRGQWGKEPYALLRSWLWPPLMAKPSWRCPLMECRLGSSSKELGRLGADSWMDLQNPVACFHLHKLGPKDFTSDFYLFLFPPAETAAAAAGHRHREDHPELSDFCLWAVGRCHVSGLPWSPERLSSLVSAFHLLFSAWQICCPCFYVCWSLCDQVGCSHSSIFLS